MSGNNPNGNSAKRPGTTGVDRILTLHGKALAVGQGVSVRLVKGPSSTQNPDPVDPNAPPQVFPILAKFPVSVVPPDFVNRKKRLYQQDVPKAVEDSEDEQDEDNHKPKKKWRGRRKEEPRRQWILQDEVEFLETMLARRENPDDTSGTAKPKLSQRYEGEPEQNTSHYLVLRVPPGADPHDRTLEACPVPVNALVSFAQPDARKTFTLSQAERVIEDQRNGVATMHHLLDDDGPTRNVGDDDDDPDERALKMQQYIRRQNKKNTAAAVPRDSKARLLSKFQSLERADVTATADDDDVMADVAYRKRKGAGTARRELLETVGDAALKVTDEGVLGGAHDAEFGGAARFGQYQAEKSSSSSEGKGKAAVVREQGAPEERGADGAAMADDFYQRDVQAEYEEMDYDANEQFDDDDVDVGEAEVQMENTGYGGLDDDEEGGDDDSEELEEEGVSGAEGLASVAGFKALLAKARGESPSPGSEDAEANGGSASDTKETANGQGRAAAAKKKENDHISKILAATGKRPKTKDRRVRAADEAEPDEEEAAPAAPKDRSSFTDIVTHGPDGLRILSKEAVRREIWLNHGSMETKRLMKMFDVKKKSPPERRALFSEIIKDLCNLQQDPVKGNILVLKQHWAHMD